MFPSDTQPVQCFTLTVGCTRQAWMELFGRSRECLRRSGTFLVDLTASGVAELRFAEVLTLAELSRSRALPGPGMRVALVAGTPASFGVCRIFQALREDLSDRLSVHSTRREAEEWLRGG